MNEQILNSLARFNKLRLTAEEHQNILWDFTQLLNDFDPLAKADTAHVEPLIQVTSQGIALRDDNAVHKVSRDEILASAPEHDQGYFLAPKILE